MLHKRVQRKISGAMTEEETRLEKTAYWTVSLFVLLIKCHHGDQTKNAETEGTRGAYSKRKIYSVLMGKLGRKRSI